MTARTKLEAWVSAFFGVELVEVLDARRRRLELEARPLVDPLRDWHVDEPRPPATRRRK